MMSYRHQITVFRSIALAALLALPATPAMARPGVRCYRIGDSRSLIPQTRCVQRDAAGMVISATKCFQRSGGVSECEPSRLTPDELASNNRIRPPVTADPEARFSTTVIQPATTAAPAQTFSAVTPEPSGAAAPAMVNGLVISVCSHGGLCLWQIRRAMGR